MLISTTLNSGSRCSRISLLSAHMLHCLEFSPIVDTQTLSILSGGELSSHRCPNTPIVVPQSHFGATRSALVSDEVQLAIVTSHDKESGFEIFSTLHQTTVSRSELIIIHSHRASLISGGSPKPLLLIFLFTTSHRLFTLPRFALFLPLSPSTIFILSHTRQSFRPAN